MRKNLVTVVTIFTLLFSSFSFGAGAGAGNGKNIDYHEVLQRFVNSVSLGVYNHEGATVSRLRSPEQFLTLAEEFESFLHAIPANLDHLRKHPLVRDFYLKSILRIMFGSAELKKGDGSGWYLGNKKGQNGHAAIRQLLEKNRLDAVGKEILRSQILVMMNDQELVQQLKTSVGLKDLGNEYLDEEFMKEMIALIKISKEHVPYVDMRPERFIVDLEKLINTSLAKKQIPVSEAFIDQIHEFTSRIENDFYDEAVDRFNQKKPFPEYYGREEEFRKIVEILNKTDKSHILLTGKAGVGKTTLIRMVQDAYIKNNVNIRGTGPAIIFEMKIDALINPYNPLEFKTLINTAKAISDIIDRHIVLYVDEAHIVDSHMRTLLKSFLTESTLNEGSKVHLIWSTTSQEARTFYKDTAFMRRWSFVNVDEFTDQQSIELVKKSFFPIWKKEHHGLVAITEDAYQFAAKMAKVEQPNAGNPTGIKELLEAAISHKMVGLQLNGQKAQNITLTAEDIMAYMRRNHGQKLMAGDPNLRGVFNKLWEEFDQEYTGQDGLKMQIKRDLLQHFSNPLERNMTAFVFAGPPGGGKSFLAEQMADKFFDGGLLTINAGELGQGAMGVSKLLGSSAGYVGSEDQHSILTKFFADNPKGGVIKIEEADYLSHEIIQLFTNMITDRKVMDGLGKEWDTSKYILVMNTNIGQELMIPSNTKNKMTWEQYDIRRNAITEKSLVDGKRVETVKKDRGDAVFEQFVSKIVMKSNADADTSIVSQEAQKQKRRYKFYYIMPPTKEELMLAAEKKVQKYVKLAKANYQVTFEIDPKIVSEIIDIENFDFEKGYGYVNQQLEDKLFQFLNNHLHEKGKTFSAELKSSVIEFEGKKLPEKELWLSSTSGSAQEVEKYSLGVKLSNPENQWANSQTMRDKIKSFALGMNKYIKGNENQIQDTKELLKLKMQDWNTRVVISQLGTTGNGKTEYFKAMAKTLYGSDEAMFKITGLNHPYDLANYFRPPKGVQGGKEETEFERWFKARLNAGGGIILFDELLSIKGLKGESLSKKIEVINQLYELLDEGFLQIGNTKYDARGFVIGITGNALQELFEGIDDTPEAEKLVKRVLSKTSHEDIVNYFDKVGVDAPKLARFGRIYLNGPLPKKVSYAITQSKIMEAMSLAEKKIGKSLKIKLDEKLSQAIVDKITTVTQGMRKVNEIVDMLIKEPIAGILNDLDDEITSIEVKYEKNEIRWYVNGKRVVLAGVKVSKDSELEERAWQFKSEGKYTDRTPQLSTKSLKQVVKQSPEEVRLTAVHEVYGHWMVAAMLERENASEAISLLPGSDYLGYVRPKPDFYSQATLTDILKRVIVLEAGHRAVFYEGVKGLGGGSFGNRTAGEAPSDDLGRIERMFDTLLSNHLVSDINEFSSEKERLMAKNVLRFIGKSMADTIIAKGRESQEFDGVFNKVMEEKFVDDVYLDAFVKKVKWAKIGDPKDLFKASLEIAVKEASSKFKTAREKALIKELAADMTKELETWSPTRPKATDKEAKANKVKKVKGDGDCKKNMKKFL